ncbi:MAG: cobalt-precorrin-6A reductase [Methylocystis sp.]
MAIIAPPSSRPARVLVLGGTSEARQLAARLAREPRIDATMSLAGRTAAPLANELPTRVGGFGGVDGLMRYMTNERIERVLDATHPFAERISANARAACRALGVPLAVFSRPPWRAHAGDHWIDVADNESAATELGEGMMRRVFLTIGRQGVGAFRAAAQHDYLIRCIEPPDPRDLPPRSAVVLARGPFEIEDEIALMREHGIDVVVTKNSGGVLTYAKIAAARALRLQVIVIARPAHDAVLPLADLDAAMAFLGASAAP